MCHFRIEASKKSQLCLKKNKQTAVIAKDTRLSGYALEPALVSGLASAGMHVYTLGPLPTNGLAMLTKSMNANLGIMITASHNPHFDNGLKFRSMILPDLFIDQDTPQNMYEKAGLDSVSIARKIEETLNSNIILAKNKNTISN